MKVATIVGIILIVIGVIALAYEGISYTVGEEVFELGPIRIEAQEERVVPLPPILGILSLIGGIVLVAVGSKRQ